MTILRRWLFWCRHWWRRTYVDDYVSEQWLLERRRQHGEEFRALR